MSTKTCTFHFYLFLLLFLTNSILSQSLQLDSYNIVWTSQSQNSSESMPLGGGDIGLNVWVENGEILFYISRSGTFDENNTFLKPGRVRIKLTPNPFEGNVFRQELILQDGYIKMEGGNGDHLARIHLWVNVFRPVITIEIESNRDVKAEVFYESWRHEDRLLRKNESFANSYKWAPPSDLKMHKDEIAFQENVILFYHRNKEKTIFDVTVKQQGMDAVKDQLFNPLKNLTFGGMIKGASMLPAGTYSGIYQDTEYKGWKLESSEPSKHHSISIFLHTEQTATFEEWQEGLKKTVEDASHHKDAWQETINWWNTFWNTSYIFIYPYQPDKNSPAWQAGRNYQLFRYMLGCNAYGSYPTKFNGGLFTYDPCFTDTNRCFTPDFRNWGGGTFTAQNQRLVYFPMIKSGDFEMMKGQFDFYFRILQNAELRSKVYWNHEGACFTEQLENFGLPNCSEYSWKRPEWYDKGMQYNAWLEYQWDTDLEFCLMMLETERYTSQDISEYIPFIESCLSFFNEHYQYLARLRGRKTLDENGHLILYPGSACETYKMAYNATSTIAALKAVLTRLLELPPQYLSNEQREKWKKMLERIPPIRYRECNGHTTIAPAWLWERINNSEAPQLYPVYPWGLYGIGKPGLDTAINTYTYDPDVIKFRSHTGWKQDNIFAARLGLTEEAAKYTLLKLQDSGRRFPAFWGPGFDWAPDHNWGGSGMIGLQEMLMQVDNEKIYLFPAWPKEWDVHFKLHAPCNTMVEGILLNGTLESLIVIPESRKKDIINLLNQQND